MTTGYWWGRLWRYLPILLLAEDSVTLPVTSAGDVEMQTTSIPPWERWNDYGIGLFRTEFLFASRAEPPSEDEQFEAYAAALKAFDHPVIIRTLDVGADKQLPYLDSTVEENPFLGILVGALFTALVQSSSATTGVVIVLAGQGLITLEAGVALVLGANIGTSVTAMLAAIGKPRDAQRAAVAHHLQRRRRPHLVALYQKGRQTVEGQQVVILSKTLPAEVNSGYHDVNDLHIIKVNGFKIHNLRALIRIIESKYNSPFVVFESRMGLKIVLERKRAENEQAKILKIYSVPADRSEDLK